jgi:hypothetical protein
MASAARVASGCAVATAFAAALLSIRCMTGRGSPRSTKAQPPVSITDSSSEAINQ